MLKLLSRDQLIERMKLKTPARVTLFVGTKGRVVQNNPVLGVRRKSS